MMKESSAKRGLEAGIESTAVCMKQSILHMTAIERHDENSIRLGDKLFGSVSSWHMATALAADVI
jgi:hypothetical protein